MSCPPQNLSLAPGAVSMHRPRLKAALFQPALDLVFRESNVRFDPRVRDDAALYVSGVRNISDATEAAVALRPLAGDFTYLLFALGLVNAALLSAAILPLATAYNICEGLGAESGVNKRFSEAPVFYWLYTFLIVCGAGVVIIPRLPLIKLILFSQVANGALLPFLLVFMLILVNRGELMGEYTNSRLANVIAWGTQHHHYRFNDSDDLDYLDGVVVCSPAITGYFTTRARRGPNIAMMST